MFSVEIDYLVRKEQYKDLQQEVARLQLVRPDQQRRSSHAYSSFRRLAGWVGTQMVKWGCKLQHHTQYRHQTLTQ